MTSSVNHASPYVGVEPMTASLATAVRSLSDAPATMPAPNAKGFAGRPLLFFFTVSAGALAPLSRWPRQMATRQHVNVEMMHGLTGVEALVRNDAIPARPELRTDFGGRREQARGTRAIVHRGELTQMRGVHSRNHQDVHGCDRIRIVKSDDMFVA